MPRGFECAGGGTEFRLIWIKIG